ncbi:hypothetical protein, partial [Lysinibacillus boronitolerans]|uniref:hypothetical protein n=1 Tax=Lysinibacillus boronitolerans TaxID=309788 RepID=UPI0038520B2D
LQNTDSSFKKLPNLFQNVLYKGYILGFRYPFINTRSELGNHRNYDDHQYVQCSPLTALACEGGPIHLHYVHSGIHDNLDPDNKLAVFII